MVIDEKKKALFIAHGYAEVIELMEADTCPFCKKKIKEEDFHGNAVQMNERKISGLCHWCQLDYFNKDGSFKADAEKLFTQGETK